MYYTDDVRGTIVDGPALTLYKFFTKVAGVEDYLGSELFQTDEEAEAYARSSYPAAYARGIEMRVWERRAN